MTNVYETLIHQYDQLHFSINQNTNVRKAWFNKSDLFNAECFVTHSEDLNDYLAELKMNIVRLQTVDSVKYAEHLTAIITDQFSCFRSLLNSLSVNEKHKHYKVSMQSRIQKMKKLTTHVTQSSRELYQELSKLQEYERRLLEMVREKQQTLNQYSGQKNRVEYQQQVLVTQQRLGRCRQAISKIEEQIQQLDSRG